MLFATESAIDYQFNYIQDPYILLQQSVKYIPEPHSEFHHPFLEGVRLQTNVLVVLSASEAISGMIPAGQVNAKYLQSLILDNSSFKIYNMKIANLHNLLTEYLLETKCTAGQQQNILQIHGLIVNFNNQTCMIDSLLLCTWFVSSSDRCRRWSVVDPQENVSIAIFAPIVVRFPSYFENLTSYMDSDLSTGIIRFTRQYFASTFDNFAYNDVHVATISHQFFKVIFISIFLSCIFFNLRDCYRTTENDPNNNFKELEVNEIQVEEDSDLLIFPSMTRREIVEELASMKSGESRKLRSARSVIIGSNKNSGRTNGII
eukprot:EST42105.1 hypothetical protein SS50377_18414 [Spironucleus salmonicida]